MDFQDLSLFLLGSDAPIGGSFFRHRIATLLKPDQQPCSASLSLRGIIQKLRARSHFYPVGVNRQTDHLFGVARTPHLDCRRDQVCERHLFALFLFHMPRIDLEAFPWLWGVHPTESQFPNPSKRLNSSRRCSGRGRPTPLGAAHSLQPNWPVLSFKSRISEGAMRRLPTWVRRCSEDT